MLLRDTRDYQILFLATFLLLGLSTRDWSIAPYRIGLAIAACIFTQWAFEWGRTVRASSPECLPPHLRGNSPKAPDSNSAPSKWSAFLNIRSPLITALSLSLLLRTGHDATLFMAGSCAIASKYLFRAHGKHFFNPANFGIIAVLLFTKDGWVSPGQWGDDLWYVLLFAGAGGIVLKRVGRWDTTITFLSTYATLMAMRMLWLGWTWDVWLHQLMNGSLLLFALFMLTDPRSIPNARQGRVIWSVAIAILTVILQTLFFVPSAVFWALFVIAPCTLLIDRWCPGDRFVWRLSTLWARQPSSLVRG